MDASMPLYGVFQLTLVWNYQDGWNRSSKISCNPKLTPTPDHLLKKYKIGSEVQTESVSRCPNPFTHGPLARYVKLWVAHPPVTFSPPPRVRDPDMHHGTCVRHVTWCMPRSLTSSFLWNRWQGKRSRHSRRMHNPQFYVSGKRPMKCVNC